MIGDFVFRDQMAAGIDGGLHIVAAVKSVLAVHSVRFLVGGKKLRLLAVLQLPQVSFVCFFAAMQFLQSGLDRFGCQFRLAALLGVRGIHPGQVALHLFVNMRQFLFQNLDGVYAFVTVDRPKFAPVHGQ